MYSDDDYIPQYCVMAGPSGDENVPLTLGSSQKSGKDSQHLPLDEPYVFREHSTRPNLTCDLELDPRPKSEKNIDRRRSGTMLERRQEIGSEQSRDTLAVRETSTSHITFTNTFSQALDAITAENSLSLGKLGKSLRQFEINVGNKELLKSKISTVHSINLDQIKNLQAAVNTLRPSSDLVVRDIEAIIRAQSNIIAGLCLTVDTILASQHEQKKQIQRTSFYIAKFKQGSALPKGTEFKRKNFTRSWKLDACSPFKETNMIQVFEKWSPSPRASRGDHFLAMIEFTRFYLLQACEPEHEIQNYACRQSGNKGRDPHLKDLPETLVVFLINFILDGFGLFADELLLSAADCARQANSYWHNLAENDEERLKMFDKLVEARVALNGVARIAIGRALADLRAYKFKSGTNKLVPPMKKRTYKSTVDSDASIGNEDGEHEIEEDL